VFQEASVQSLLLFILVFAAQTNSKPPQMQGNVTDYSGAVVADAAIWAIPNHCTKYCDGPMKSVSLHATTDQTGAFYVQLDRGVAYDIFVTRTGLAPHCEQISLRESKTFSVKLAPANEPEEVYIENSPPAIQIAPPKK
jgi:hypothetical protein